MEFAVMALGLRLLWNLRITKKEKLALGTIFSVGFIKIAFAAIRVVKIGASSKHVNPIWLALWSMVEASVAVIVACLPSFRVLFRHGRRHSGGRVAVRLKPIPQHPSNDSYTYGGSNSTEAVQPLSSSQHPNGMRPESASEEVNPEDTVGMH